jgi:ribosomal protein L37AE/L43A
MKPGKYDRNITLLCPTCGSEKLEKDEFNIVKCVACDGEFTREEMVRSNEEIIRAALKEVKEEEVIKEEAVKNPRKRRGGRAFRA